MQRSNEAVPAGCIYQPTHAAVKWFAEDDMAALTVPHAVPDHAALLNCPLEVDR